MQQEMEEECKEESRRHAGQVVEEVHIGKYNQNKSVAAASDSVELVAPRSTKSGPVNLHPIKLEEQIVTEFYCFLKTKKGKFKKHFMAIGEESISFFRRHGETESRQVHSLK